MFSLQVGDIEEGMLKIKFLEGMASDVGGLTNEEKEIEIDNEQIS